jgi:exopolysaccharide biosynthesis polyprenyl glycosylphosphotransferase
MHRRFTLRYIAFSLFLDVACVISALVLAEHLRQALPYGLVDFNATYPQGIPPAEVYAIAIGLWIATAFTLSLYDPKKIYKVVDEYQTLTLAVGFFSLTITGVLYFTYRHTSRMLMIYALGLTWVMMMGWRAVVRFARRSRRNAPQNTSRVLIVGAGEVGRRVAAMILEYNWIGLQLEGYLDDNPAKHGNSLPVLGTLEEIERVVREREIDNVILALPPQAHERINLTVSRLHKLPVRVRVVPDYFSLALYRATVDDFGGIPMINLRDPALSPYQRLGKRALDLVVGGALTLCALPVMGAVAVAIKLDSPGPVLFRQPRVGENGRLFKMVKFRSMVQDAEELQAQVNTHDAEGHVIHKQKNDPRVTRVGRFIRHYSLDELPQFYNVLIGEMSLVGPRPELPWLVEEYEPWQRRRFAVPQGITGWWQVNGRSDKAMHLHTDEDLYYIQNYSLWLDIYILLKTPWVILRGKGAY